MQKSLIYGIFGSLLFGGILWFMITISGGNSYFSFSENTINTNSDITQKLYVANEWDSSVSVIDTNTNKLIKSISLSRQYYGKYLQYMAHNVQVWPWGTIIAVTANIFEKEEWWVEMGMHAVNSDELILIDPLTDTIVSRIEIEVESHLAHVIIDKMDTTAYIASQEKWIIDIVDLKNKKILKKVTLPLWSQPHGMRLSVDGKQLFIAMIGEKAIWILNIEDSKLELIPTGYKTMQVAASPDGQFVFASLFDTKSIGKYDLATKKLMNISLPDWAQWAIQIYPTPDSKFLYIADQGFYFDQPTSTQIYKMDITTGKIIKSYTGGQAPHGIVVSPDGKFVYISNLLSNNITVIDTIKDSVISRIDGWIKPNGVSIWTKWIWGTP